MPRLRVKSSAEMIIKLSIGVQIGELNEVAELRWDGASELILGDVSERQ